MLCYVMLCYAFPSFFFQPLCMCDGTNEVNLGINNFSLLYVHVCQ